MGAYSVVHQTAAGADLPIINVTGTASVRVAIAEIILGSDASPADHAGEFVVNRTTDAGTGGTSITPRKLDPVSNDPAASAKGGTFGTPPADTANSELLMFGLHQRNSFRWVAMADRFRLFSVLASANGLMLNCVGHTATPNVNATILWEE